MAGTLNQFTTEIKNRNVSRTNLFAVQIVSPNGVGNVTPDRSTDSLLPFFCYGASTPSFNFLTQDNYSTAGTKRKFIYDHDYANLRLEFYVDQNYETKKYFDSWKSLILNTRRNFAFPDDYTSDKLYLSILNLDDKEVYRYSYSKVFPKTISEINLSWLNGNQISTFNVEFTFEEVYFEQTTSLVASNEDSDFAGGITMTSDIEKLSNLIPVPIASITNNELINKFKTDINNSSDPAAEQIIRAFNSGVLGSLFP